ncbi:chaperone modulator CbpM [Hydrogenophaga sp. BPS33]|uniref:chaperone modulator CbpM n=1 Tax=Hydrogenophaga sp. BPS33 TaxID=2651974 RepID=UPI001320193D|nr:chaperone modulator CbpM [Hydrogenophaga sp. BPS33]QHE86252.1 MerR family transcriptional regulator [Hydrogenophaga sp. BPS33]
MKDPVYQVQVVLDDVWLDLAQLSRLAGVTEAWVQQRLEEGLLNPQAVPAFEVLRFDANDLHRAVRMAHLERDFDAVPELASLVVDLEQELAHLRAKLLRLGG